jgi:aminotransferase
LSPVAQLEQENVLMKRPFVAEAVKDIPLSGIREVVVKAAKLEAEGKRVIHFVSGRPDFDTPGHIKAATAKALEDGLVHYAPNAGIPLLRQAMSGALLRHKKLAYDPETEIFMTAGGQEAMYLGLKATINPGDEVLVPDPGFGLFFSSIRLVGGSPVSVPHDEKNGFTPDLQAAENLVTDRTRAIIINSPHNPSGAVLNSAQIEAVCRFAEKHDLLIFSDDAYDRMLYDGAECVSPAALPGMKDRTLILGSLSKTYAMTGWRIGYIAANKEIISAALRIQQNVMISLCHFIQLGAAAALNGSQQCVDQMVSEFAKRRDVIIEGIEKSPGLSCPVKPLGAFYVFAKHDVPGMDSVAVSDYLLEEGGAAVVPGNYFGSNGEGYIRISYACSIDDCREGMDRITGAMEKLMRGR